ncbi:MAG: RecQ family ATP-dependent DNA helicase [Bacteroidetes bacterium]|nr:RecQ family ATP-dependent DNA helicase [Bacteroidota bacterium]MCH8524013.1 RecQ family ATP-dependent DNA helicase [Balneolales bacterium]
MDYNQAKQNLKKYWGFDDFRPGQDEVVQSVLDGNETLVLFPTGGGKSLCYQVPATVLPGLTLVISPLVALMQDQVDQLNKRGIRSAFINSTLPQFEVEQRLINARNGMYTLLYCAPERLETNLFQQEAPNLNIQLVAVDEAHCISEWGHDFRPPYRRIRENIEACIGKTRFMALTATATPRVKEDIISVMGFRNPVVISKGFERKNLKWWVKATEQKSTTLLNMVQKAPGSGLVYASTRRGCNELAALVRSKGIACEAYHAGLTSLDRKRIQEQWIDNTLPLVVATNAFGMGIDKPDCRYVIHYDIAYSLEAYYQEAGRAGRDGELSFPTLLVKKSDLVHARKRLNDSYPDYDLVQRVYTLLCDTLHLALGSVHEGPQTVSLQHVSKRSGLRNTLIMNCLRVLNRLGVIVLSQNTEPQFGIRFNRNKDVLLDIMLEWKNEAKQRFLENLMRLYIPESLNDTHFIDQSTVMTKLELTYNGVVKGLDVLSNEGLLKWESRTDDPVVQVLEARSSRAPITRKEVEQFRDIQKEKLEMMIGYALTSGCRSAYIRRYFGEEEVPESCGFCDRCLAVKRNTYNEEDIKRTLLELKKSPLTLTQIARVCKIPEESAMQMLRWLATERKVRYTKETAQFSLR